jgi:hypothetical protein
MKLTSVPPGEIQMRWIQSDQRSFFPEESSPFRNSNPVCET